MGKKSRSGSGMKIPDHISESLLSLENFFGLKILKFLDADADPDPGSRMEKFVSGIRG
jgi:hypothetical protein